MPDRAAGRVAHRHAGLTTADILVDPNDDNVWEPSEQFTVTLNSRYNGSCTWTGNMTTTTLTGTVQWSRDGKTYNYTFTGVPFTPVEAES